MATAVSMCFIPSIEHMAQVELAGTLDFTRGPVRVESDNLG